MNPDVISELRVVKSRHPIGAFTQSKRAQSTDPTSYQRSCKTKHWISKHMMASISDFFASHPTDMSDTDIVVRLLFAVVGGMILGLDRELRGISAGIRTHAIVALSSAAITVSALLLFDALSSNPGAQNIDPLRVVQGLAQAIGFIAAGAIFFARGDVHNLTSAANLWLASAIGIASGAGQYVLFGTALVLGIILITLVRLMERLLLGNRKPEDELRKMAPSEDEGERTTGRLQKRD